jgi:hypothetical protein
LTSFQFYFIIAKLRLKGSRKNKFAIYGVAALVRQGAKVQEYRDISSLGNAAGQDAATL